MLPSPPSDEPLTEVSFLMTIDSLLEKYKEVPNPSCMLMSKYLRLLKECVEGFKELQHQRTTLLNRFNERNTGMVFDLSIRLDTSQFWGYYARLQHMESHYMASWEEMSHNEFFYPNSIFLRGAGPSMLRYNALRKASADADYKPVGFTDEEKERQYEIEVLLETPFRVTKEKDTRGKGKGKDTDRGKDRKDPSRGRD